MHLVGLSCLHPPGSLSIGIATQCALRVGKRRAPNNKNHIRKSKGQRRTRTDRRKYKLGDNMAPTKNKRVTIFKISNSFSGAYANNESNLHLPTRRSNDNEPHIMTIDDNRLA